VKPPSGHLYPPWQPVPSWQIGSQVTDAGYLGNDAKTQLNLQVFFGEEWNRMAELFMVNRGYINMYNGK
jgi:hypothetical protein